MEGLRAGGRRLRLRAERPLVGSAALREGLVHVGLPVCRGRSLGSEHARCRHDPWLKPVHAWERRRFVAARGRARIRVPKPDASLTLKAGATKTIRVRFAWYASSSAQAYSSKKPANPDETPSLWEQLVHDHPGELAPERIESQALCHEVERRQRRRDRRRCSAGSPDTCARRSRRLQA